MNAERETLLASRAVFFGGLWPDGAPIEGWAEKCRDSACRHLSRYVLFLERRLATAEALARGQAAEIDEYAHERQGAP